MSAVFGVAIWCIAIFFIVRKVKAQASGSKPGIKGKASNPGRTFTNYRPHKDIVSVSRDMGDKKGDMTLRDDRNNDWLAQQLREEHKAFKATSEMFDLKIEHASHCDARLLEQFHRRNCTASGIDLANGKTLKN